MTFTNENEKAIAPTRTLVVMSAIINFLALGTKSPNYEKIHASLFLRHQTHDFNVEIMRYTTTFQICVCLVIVMLPAFMLAKRQTNFIVGWSMINVSRVLAMLTRPSKRNVEMLTTVDTFTTIMNGIYILWIIGTAYEHILEDS